MYQNGSDESIGSGVTRSEGWHKSTAVPFLLFIMAGIAVAASSRAWGIDLARAMRTRFPSTAILAAIWEGRYWIRLRMLRM